MWENSSRFDYTNTVLKITWTRDMIHETFDESKELIVTICQIIKHWVECLYTSDGEIRTSEICIYNILVSFKMKGRMVIKYYNPEGKPSRISETYINKSVLTWES